MERTKDAHQVFDSNAALYARKYMNLSPFHSSFDLFCESVVLRNPSIFEMACGPGNITQYLLSKRPDFKLLGTDVSQNMLELAKENNPSTQFELMDCREIDLLNQKFDGVVSGFVIPYLTKEDVVKLMVDVVNALRIGGIFYLNTMVAPTTYSDYVEPSSGDGMALLTHFYDVAFLEGRLKKEGFKIIESGYVAAPNTKESGIQDWWMVGSKIIP